MSAPTPDLFDSLPASGSRTAPGGPRAAPAVAPGVVPRASRELWLCLRLPALPLEALVGPQGGREGIVGVVEGEGSRQVVVAASAAAARRGVRPGLGLNAALALVPELELHERRPDAEAALLDRLARWATRFTPLVSLEPPQALLAEVRGSLGLFGGAEALRMRAITELGERGLHALATIAPTPRSALWLARAGCTITVDSPDALPSLAARLPLGCLDWPVDVTQTLVTLGIRSVADLVRLPRDGFARRFGPALLDELDEGFGRRPQPRRRAVAAERFDENLELPVESDSASLIGAALEHLVDRLQAFLRMRSAGIRGIVVEFRHRDLPATRLRLGLARPTGDGRHLVGLLRERLGRTPLPAPAWSLRLRSTATMPLALQTVVLPGETEQHADPEASARLLERLRARLGSDSVFSVCLVPEHRPEAAWRVAEPSVVAPGGKKRGQSPFRLEKGTVPFSEAPLAPRPLWMLAEPQRLRERDDEPLHEGLPLELISGPERIETGWWDGRDVRRDYFVAQGRAGVRLWLYRERSRGGGWWLHGVFG